ncbi:hypothetical protein [Actinomadura bangladeshensis]|uniref:Uncharacterized protein n=1 Tax=Actinomadura bangladeshensis TaxID=453573 RepID=A0A4R4PBI7_9ACTN|nr:hypothetical protein [Actinomadura bangladeshensis]TDC18363.1 hypothetical protein E1284_06445 [Actinomadura bangladeshensis]
MAQRSRRRWAFHLRRGRRRARASAAAAPAGRAEWPSTSTLPTPNITTTAPNTSSWTAPQHLDALLRHGLDEHALQITAEPLGQPAERGAEGLLPGRAELDAHLT